MRPSHVLCAVVAAAVGGQDVAWSPDAPLEGSLVTIRADRPLTGELAGEPLHFYRDSAGAYVAYAAVPLGAPDSASLLLHDDAGTAIARGIAVRRRPRGRVSQLRPDTVFTRPPDSALTVRLVRERQLVAEVMRGSHQRPRLWSQGFVAPRPGAVRSPFGAIRGFSDAGDESRHRGADLAGTRGAPVFAANRGVVALVGDFFYSGTVVYVDHGAGLITAYAHLSAAVVSIGDTVRRHQEIGKVGATGRVTGPHLHWTALYGRIAFDPEDLLRY